MTCLFEIVEGGSIRDEVEEEEEIIRWVNIGVFGGIRGVEGAVINGVGRDIIGATKGLTELELLFLWTKKTDKYSSDDNSCILVTRGPPDEEESKAVHFGLFEQMSIDVRSMVRDKKQDN